MSQTAGHVLGKMKSAPDGQAANEFVPLHFSFYAAVVLFKVWQV